MFVIYMFLSKNPSSRGYKFVEFVLFFFFWGGGGLTKVPDYNYPASYVIVNYGNIAFG